MTELLPCPFCGGKAEHIRGAPVIGDYVMCTNGDCNVGTAMRDNREQAALDWNRRAGDGPLTRGLVGDSAVAPPECSGSNKANVVRSTHKPLVVP